MTLRRDQSGTTMMELVVYLSISVLVVLSMTTFVTALTKSRVETSEQQLLQDSARTVIERMTYAVRNSAQVAVSGSRLDATNESGIVWSFCGCDGTVKAGQANGAALPADSLEPLIDPTVALDQLVFETVGSSVVVQVQLSKNGRTASLNSTIAIRQLP